MTKKGVASPIVIGRAGSADVGVPDAYCPAVVAEVEAGEHDWTLSVPTGLCVEVTLERLDPPAPTLSVDGAVTVTAEAATVSFCTDGGEHAVCIVWDSEQARGGRRRVDLLAQRLRGRTKFREPGIDLRTARHRAIVAACANRVRTPGAPPLSDEAIAEALGISHNDHPHLVKRRMSHAVRDVCYLKHNCFPDELAGGFTRADAVEFLVRTRRVTPDTIARAVEIESGMRGDGSDRSHGEK